MKTKNGLLCLLLFTLASCGGGGAGSKSRSIPNIDPSTVPQSAPRSETRAEETPTLEVRVKRKTPFLNDFSNFDAFVEDINSYSVSFLAKAGHYYGAEVTCYKKNYDPIPTKSVQKFDSSGLKAQMILSMNETDSQTVLFTCHVVNGSDEFDKVTIELKKSLVVKGRQDIVAFGLSGVTKVETLVLDTDSVLSTEGNNFHLRVKEIISRKGKIVTFPEDYKHEPKNDEKGKSSGLINITAERVWGLISFELRGLDAGSQTKVPSQQPRRGIPVGYNNNKSQCQAARGTEGYQGQTELMDMMVETLALSKCLLLKIHCFKFLSNTFLAMVEKVEQVALVGKVQLEAELTLFRLVAHQFFAEKEKEVQLEVRVMKVLPVIWVTSTSHL
jgi:hypothetical protein